MKNDSITDKNKIHNHSANENECSKIIIKTNLKNSIKEANDIYNIYNISIPRLNLSEITKNKSDIPKYTTIKSSL